MRQLSLDPLSVKPGSKSSWEDEGVLIVEDWEIGHRDVGEHGLTDAIGNFHGWHLGSQVASPRAFAP